jgi:hypothetical protein
MLNAIAKQSVLPTDEQRISYEVCLKSIPLSESNSAEAEEYITYFCGLECYDLWVHQEEADTSD